MRCLILGMLVLLGVGEVVAQTPTSALPPIELVSYDSNGRFLVNGKPFFPILLYSTATDETTLKQLREFHFNVLTCRPQDCDALPAQGFYGAVHVGKKFEQGTSGVLLTMGTDSPALYYKKNLLAQTAEANGKVTALVPNRPIMNAIGYWEDEPEGVFSGKLPSKAVYEDLVAAIDVSAPYLYPVPYQPVASVGEAIDRARVASKGSKPLLPILQLFAWKATDRYPTPTELRCMAFLSLVEGAQGIGYYSYSSVTGKPKTTIAEAQPELWQSVRELNADLAAIGPRLLAGKPADVKVASGADVIKLKAIHDDRGLLIVAVNSSPHEQPVEFLGSALQNEDSIQLNTTTKLPVKDGRVSLKLPAFGVSVISSRPSP